MEHTALAALGATALVVAFGFARYHFLNAALDRSLAQIEADQSSGTFAAANTGSSHTVARYDVDQALALIRKGANVNRENADGLTPLMTACEWGNIELARAMLDQGGRLNSQDRSGATPLHHAVRSGNGFLVELLLARGAPPDLKDQRGETPLFEACREGSVRSVRALLEHGADPNARDAIGTTPLANIRSKEAYYRVTQPRIARDFPGWRDCRALLQAHGAVLTGS